MKQKKQSLWYILTIFYRTRASSPFFVKIFKKDLLQNVVFKPNMF